MNNKAKRLNDDYLECRLNHLMVRITNPERIPNRPRADRWGKEIWHECTRCEMRRVIKINSLGVIGARAYLAPEGYKMTQDELPTKAQLRLELVRRFDGITPGRIVPRPVKKPLATKTSKK